MILASKDDFLLIDKRLYGEAVECLVCLEGHGSVHALWDMTAFSF